jgi:hypothetical protein
MTMDEDYRQDLAALAARIGGLDPPDLADRFASHFSCDAGSFRQVEPVKDGTIAAVDGSNAMLLDAGYVAVALIRAAACGFAGGPEGHQPGGGQRGGAPVESRRAGRGGERGGQQPEREPTGRIPGGEATGRSPGATRRFRSLTPLRVMALGQEARDGTFAGLYRECFGTDPGATVRDDEPARTAGILRDTLEYWVALQACGRLSRGDLLVLDGALRVTHASHDPVMQSLIGTCAAGGILLCAVTKRTSVTWGGGYPLVPAATALARAQGITPPWFLRIGEEGLDTTPYRQWRHGSACVAALHPRSPLAFKLEVPAATGDEALGEVVARLAGWSDDGRVTGYPYPLLDAHRTARIPADALARVKNDLLAGLDLSRGGSRYQELFGDLHDEFARY